MQFNYTNCSSFSSEVIAENVIDLEIDIDAIRAGIFRIERRKTLPVRTQWWCIIIMPTSVSTKLPCETIDELIVFNSMDEHMLNLVCILNYRPPSFLLFLLTTYISSYVLFNFVLMTWYQIWQMCLHTCSFVLVQ